MRGLLVLCFNNRWLGAMDFIAKPFIVDDFMERVAHYISPAETSETAMVTGR